MFCRGFGLSLCLFFIISGCTSLEGKRWALLGDTSERAFFLDLQEVERLPGGNYSYPVKSCLYQEGKVHKQDDSRMTHEVLFVELDCRNEEWAEVGRGVMDSSDKILFRHISINPEARSIEPDTIHQVAYNYFCGDSDLVAQHNH